MRVYIIFIWLLLTGITKWEVQTTLRYFLFPLQEMETTTENHSQPKCEVVQASSHGHIYNASPTPNTQGSLQKKGEKIKRARESIEEFAVKCQKLVDR